MVAVLVNVATVLLGSMVGLIFRNKINEKFTKAVISALALVTILIGLQAFDGHPFKVEENADMQSLIESIRDNGILTPFIVRPVYGDKYEIVSGHRRLFACNVLGITEVPAVVKDLTREEAVIEMVDSNIHREKILPSEKAFAYKMKMDVLPRFI